MVRFDLRSALLGIPFLVAFAILLIAAALATAQEPEPPQPLPEQEDAQPCAAKAHCSDCCPDCGRFDCGRGCRGETGTPCFPYGDNHRPDLFYNYYVPPNCGVGAQMYVAPLPVPPKVGHTYYTYQPLMPHEFLYPHTRSYHRYYDRNRGLNRTVVSWETGGLSHIPSAIFQALKPAR